MAVALRTLASNGGGTLVASGYQGEAERLALLAPHHHVVVEPTAQSTWDNVERSIPYIEEADRVAIASDWFHARRASHYLRQLRPDLSARLVPAGTPVVGGWWIQAGGAAYEGLLASRRLPGRHDDCRCWPAQAFPVCRDGVPPFGCVSSTSGTHQTPIARPEEPL